MSAPYPLSHPTTAPQGLGFSEGRNLRIKAAPQKVLEEFPSTVAALDFYVPSVNLLFLSAEAALSCWKDGFDASR